MKQILNLLENFKIIFDWNLLKDIFKHPEAHTKELPIILSILSLITLSIIIYYYITVIRKYRVDEPYEVSLRKNGIYFAVSFAITIVFLYVPLLYISSSRSCLNCHKPEGLHTTLLEQAHRNVPCESCHLKRGYVGRLEAFFKLTSKIISYDVLQERDFSNTCCISPANCLGCHYNVLQETVNSHFIQVSHREILEKFTDCSICHVFNKGKPKSSLTVMQICGECHNGIEVSSRCETCHIPFGKIEDIKRDLEDYPKVTEKGPPPVTEGIEPTPSVNLP
jgi:hypothetical protein